MTTVFAVIFSCTLAPVGKGPIAVPRWRMSVGSVEFVDGQPAKISRQGFLDHLDVEAIADANRVVTSVTLFDSATGVKGTGVNSAEVYGPAAADGAQQGYRVACAVRPIAP